MCCLLPDHSECAPGRCQLQHNPVVSTNFTFNSTVNKTSANETASLQLDGHACVTHAQCVPSDNESP